MEIVTPAEETPRTAYELLSKTWGVLEFKRPQKIDVAAILENRAPKIALIDAIHCLTDRQRRCIQLLFGYRSLRAKSREEIAAMEGISVNRVGTEIRQGLAFLSRIVTQAESLPTGELFYDDRRVSNSDEFDYLRPGHEYNDLLAPRGHDDTFTFQEIRKRAPSGSGCYAWVDGISGEVLRIGKAKSLWFRLMEYHDDRSRAVLLMWQWLEDHREIFDALQIKVWKQKNPDLLEVSLLMEFRPRFNVIFGALPFERRAK